MNFTLAYSHSALNDFDNCPLAFYHKRVLKDVKDPPSSFTEYGTFVHKAFEDRLKVGKALPDTLKKYEAICAKMAVGGEVIPEYELALRSDLSFTSWFGRDVFFRIKIDVVKRLDPQLVWINDWKTGKRKSEFTQLERSAWGVMLKHPEVEKVRATYTWLKDDKFEPPEEYTRDMLPEMTERIISKCVQIENARKVNNWPARPSGLCNYCGFKPHCDYAKR